MDTWMDYRMGQQGTGPGAPKPEPLWEVAVFHWRAKGQSKFPLKNWGSRIGRLVAPPQLLDELPWNVLLLFGFQRMNPTESGQNLNVSNILV